MNSTSKRMLFVGAGVVGCVACATALTAVAELRPWGVRDADLEKYDRLVAEMDERDRLQEEFAKQKRPIVQAVAANFNAELRDPLTEQTHPFVIRNTGDQPLELSVLAAASCDAKIESEVVPPGKDTIVEAKWTTPEASEYFEHRITVRTNDPLNSTVRLMVYGESKSRIVVPDGATFEVADPATQTTCDFVVYSQTSDQLQIEEASSDVNLFEWHADPLSLSDPEVAGLNAKSAWRVRIWSTPIKYGKFSSTMQLVTSDGQGEKSTHEIALQWRVRPPIVFQSPDIHRVDGLDIGTVFSGEEHNHYVTVRLRGDLDRDIEVLDIQPPELKATVTPQKIRGNYRLTITIPADCPYTVFNIAEKHGYVKVGDPNDPEFKSWFPIHGAVVPPE